ncbi:putative bifunctional diguanylate cyclase/phosphodiesterase [Crossiella cryophila]|uniref:Diguanylate cyclase (GGDEF)-like protein/PAS domain S-box-containing protein n=1 Tax=Crossiella cryophila TaxID=43355 RepID=A0A7W7CB75_9PSEU|nr:EAL domain-containing protein [Crossiella cryophila]MBB4677936.1 diguanylate cyclase (GGDEF)-like protein/PAS domain S-box-containing protein [Crossiella cryophila]
MSATGRTELARQWAAAVGTAAYVPLSREQLELQLLDLVDELLDLVLADPFDARPAGRAGAQLVVGNITSRLALRRSIEILGAGCRRELSEHRDAPDEERVTALLAEFAAGYTEGVRQLTFNQQEELKKALLHAKRDAERELRVSESRFRELFTASAMGIAISDLDGNFIEVNQAFTEILGYTGGELGFLTVPDLFAPEETADLAVLYRHLVDEPVDRFRCRTRLVSKEADSVFAYLAVSLLHDADGRPNGHVTMVEDLTNLHLLQGRFSHQTLHDQLTGLPNRQYLHSRLQSVLGRVEEGQIITLCHLDLDSFTVINDGLGHHIGDELLKTTAQRLRAAVTGYNAMVARFGSDEFAILIEDSPTPPDVAALAARINEELAEPTYLDGYGVAVSASIGIVQRPAKGMVAAELLRQADLTLHRVKASGKAQWGLFDPAREARDRARFKLAASMPGAVENGEFSLRYEPIRWLGGGELIATEVLVEWAHPELGPLPHDRCVELAESTGLILALGRWVLKRACRDAAEWRPSEGEPPIVLATLTPYQSQDPDLVDTVRKALAEAGLPPQRLRLRLPLRTVAREDSDAADNLRVLTDMGVVVGLDEFGRDVTDFVRLPDLPIYAARFDRALVDRLGEDPDPGSPVARAVATLTELAHQVGFKVIASGVDSRAKLDWLTAIGVDAGQGRQLGLPRPAEAFSGVSAGAAL